MRVLFVCMPGSVHAARWISHLKGLGWDLHVFGAVMSRVHPDFEEVTVHGWSRYRPPGLSADVRLHGVWPFRRGAFHAGAPFARFEPQRLARLVRRLRPDVVHSLELQHAGYLTLAARDLLHGEFPPWIVTNYGSDIYWYARFPEHEAKLRGLLAGCDYYTCECARDVPLARDLGFAGEVLSVAPNAGGLDLRLVSDLRSPGPPSQRRLIVLKGYDFWPGKALVALSALEKLGSALDGYEVAVTVAAPAVKAAVARLAASGIRISVVPQGSHSEILRLYGQTRVAVALSVSDGISTSTLEALALGAFPIQSNTSCLDEWIVDGESGILVEPDDELQVSEAILKALTDDQLVDRAATLNWSTAEARLDRRDFEPRVRRIYEHAAAAAR